MLRLTNVTVGFFLCFGCSQYSCDTSVCINDGLVCNPVYGKTSPDVCAKNIRYFISQWVCKKKSNLRCERNTDGKCSGKIVHLFAVFFFFCCTCTSEFSCYDLYYIIALY